MVARVQGQRGWAAMTSVCFPECRAVPAPRGHSLGLSVVGPGVDSYFSNARKPPSNAGIHKPAQIRTIILRFTIVVPRRFGGRGEVRRKCESNRRAKFIAAIRRDGLRRAKRRKPT